jgi:dihydrofolate reductase
MTRTQYFAAGSLDGYIADSDGRLDWLSQFADVEGKSDHYEQFFANVGSLAMGARSYEFILGLDEPWVYGDRPTWIFSRRDLPRVDGADLRFVSGDVRLHHEAMCRAAGDRNVWLVGGGDLVAQFVTHDLLDELWLGLAPVILGGGAPLLPARSDAPWSLHEVVRLGDFLTLRYTARGH